MVQKRETKAINKLCVREILSLSFVCGAYFFEFRGRNLVCFGIAYNFEGMRTAFFTRVSHIWVMTRHQYGISALVSQTSFHGETSGDDANVGFFLRLWSPPILPFVEADRLLSKEHGSTNKGDGFVTILVVGHSIQAIS